MRQLLVLHDFTGDGIEPYVPMQTTIPAADSPVQLIFEFVDATKLGQEVDFT